MTMINRFVPKFDVYFPYLRKLVSKGYEMFGVNNERRFLSKHPNASTSQFPRGFPVSGHTFLDFPTRSDTRSSLLALVSIIPSLCSTDTLTDL